MQRSDPNPGALVKKNFRDGDVLLLAEWQELKTRAPPSIVIKQADLLRSSGATGCPKCMHTRDYGCGMLGGPHSAESVERFRRAFEDTEDGKKVLAG